MTLANTSAGVLTTNGTSTYSSGTGVWEVTGSVATVNTALAAVAFTPATNNDVNTTIAVNIADGLENGVVAVTGAIALNVTADNDAPTIGVNAILAVASDTLDNIIANTSLSISDVDNTPAQRTLTITTLPVNGVLYRSAVALTVGGTFVQQDIDDSLITYDHTAGTSDDDSFQFTVSDGAGGTIGITTFTIQVDGVGVLSALPPVDLPTWLFLPFVRGDEAPAMPNVASESTGAADIFLPQLFFDGQ